MKKFLSLILVLVLSLSVVGCGKKTDNEAVTLKLGIPGGQTAQPMEIVDNFKAANPNITIELDETPWNEFKRKLKMQIAASNPPDVFIMDSGYVATLGGMGAAVDLSKRIEKDLNADEFSGALFAGKDANGKVWGIPHALNSVAVVYNKNIFDKYNVPYPEENWTFEDMINIAKKLTIDEDKDGKTDIYGLLTSTNITEGWLSFVLAAGGAPLDETLTKSNIKDPKTVDGFKKFFALREEGISPSSEWIASNGNIYSSFYMGKAAMITMQMSNLVAISKNAPADFKYDAQMMPIGYSGERYCVYVPNQWAIFSKTSDSVQNAAWKWIVHYLNKDSQDMIAKMENKMPIRKTSLELSDKLNTVPEHRNVFYKGIDEYGHTLFECPTWEEWKPKVDETVAAVYAGGKSALQGIEEMDKIITEATGGN